MIISPKVIATPRWPTTPPVSASMTIAPVPAKTSAKVPTASAANRCIRRLGLAGADEGADDPSAIGVEAGKRRVVPARAGATAAAVAVAIADASGELAGVVDARHLDLDIGETRRTEQAAVLPLLQRAGDAADPCLHVRPQIGGQLALRDHVRNREPSTRLEHAEGFAQHLPLVARQVDDTVGDDDIHSRLG